MKWNKLEVYPGPFISALYKAALGHERWRRAMQEELDALEANRTWTVCSLPP